MSARPVLVTGEACVTAAPGQASVPVSAPAGTPKAAEVERRLVAALQLKVGRERDWSAEQFADHLGMNHETFRAVVTGSPDKRRRMRGGDMLVALALLGQSSLNHVLGAVGYRGARPVEAAGVCDYAMLAALCQLGGDMATALADHRLDHTERPRIAGKLRELSAMAECCASRLESEAAP